MVLLILQQSFDNPSKFNLISRFQAVVQFKVAGAVGRILYPLQDDPSC